jgi:hypothetical protein
MESYFCIINCTNSLSKSHVSSCSLHLDWLRLTVDSAVTILISLSNHLIDFVVCQLLADTRHDMAELGGGDEAVVVAVEHLEGLADLFFGIGVFHLAGHHCEEFCVMLEAIIHALRSIRAEIRRTREVNGAIVVGVDLVDHILQFRLGRVLAQGAHDGAEFFGGDLSCSISMLDWASKCEARLTIAVLVLGVVSTACPDIGSWRGD